MTLFEASFLSEPVPVKKPKGKKKQEVTPPPSIDETPEPLVKKPRKKKEAPLPPQSEPIAVATEPVKKPRKKKAVAETAIEIIEEPEPSRKRKAAAQEPDTTPEAKTVTESHKKKRTKKIIDGAAVDEPPSWFKAYMLDEAKRRNNEVAKPEKKPAVELKAVASEQASQKWKDGFTRDRVMNEVTRHQSNLYNQIFSKRL